MIYYAQNIQTGNARAQSAVVNTVEGDSSVVTHIEVEANGEKKTLDANSPGTYSLSVESNDNNNKTITPAMPTPHSSLTVIATNTTELKTKIIDHNPIKPFFFSDFLTNVKDFFKKLFKTNY